MQLKFFDFYRNIPKDLTQSSTHGAILSVCCAVFMASLFIAELWSFLSPHYTTQVIVDSKGGGALVKIFFNVTLLHVPCDFASIDINDVLGTRDENVTKHIGKWEVNENGVFLPHKYHGVNSKQADIEHEEVEDFDLEDLQHHVPLIDSIHEFESWLKNHHYTFVDFYAPWCSWCQKLEPTWQALAEEVEDEDLPISIVKVDCVAIPALCKQQKIHSFPTMRFFKNSMAEVPDYKKDRTVDAFFGYLEKEVDYDSRIHEYSEEQKKEHHEMLQAKREEDKTNPGCLLSGHLLVNKVPGNFHLEARSMLHDMNPAMANLSHIVHHLSFGTEVTVSEKRRVKDIPEDLFSLEKVMPINGNVFVNSDLHQAFHHYMKIVGTDMANAPISYSAPLSASISRSYIYQMVHSAQIMQYAPTDAPQALFEFDISPLSVVISNDGRPLYEFITSICAVIGGTFTVLGLLSGMLSLVFKGKHS